MTAGEIAGRIEQWYGAVGTAGLKLPDGWFGRPYDTLLALTSLTEHDDAVVLGLDNRHTLSIRHPDALQIDRERCLITAGGEIDWNWMEYGSDRTHQKSFAGGDVELLALVLA